MKQPRLIDIGTISCYFTDNQLKQMEEAISHYLFVTCGCNDGQEPLFEAHDLIKGYIKQYERRMKDAN